METAERSTPKIDPPGKILDNQVKMIRSRKEKPELPTGIKPLDDIVRIERKQICVIAGRPGEGKSSLAGAIAMNLADNGKYVLYVSLEMPEGDILERMMCSFSDMDSDELRKGNVPPNFDSRVGVFHQFLSKTNLRIKDSWGYDTEEINVLLRECGPKKPDVMIIDHIQKIHQGKFLQRRDAITEYALDMERIAMRHNMSVILLSQLNRDAVKGQPGMEHLKESGTLEESASVVLLLCWKTMDKDKDPSDPAFQIIVGKQRYGPSGMAINLEFHANKSKFTFFEEEVWTRTQSVSPAGQQKSEEIKELFGIEKSNPDG